MPETISQPEPEPTRPERAQRVVAQVIAGQGIVRRMVLYVVASLAMVGLIACSWHPAGLLLGGTGIMALLLLNMTDGGLS